MLSNPNPLQPSWIAFGWFIAASITSLVFLALVTLGILVPESSAEVMWTGLSLLIGFGMAGFIAGWRSGVPPLWFGVAMAVLSIVVWVGLNVVVGEPTGVTTWRSLSLPSLAAVCVLQLVAAMFGARFGLVWAITPQTDETS